MIDWFSRVFAVADRADAFDPTIAPVDALCASERTTPVPVAEPDQPHRSVLAHECGHVVHGETDDEIVELRQPRMRTSTDQELVVVVRVPLLWETAEKVRCA